MKHSFQEYDIGEEFFYYDFLPARIEHTNAGHFIYIL